VTSSLRLMICTSGIMPNDSTSSTLSTPCYTNCMRFRSSFHHHYGRSSVGLSPNFNYRSLEKLIPVGPCDFYTSWSFCSMPVVSGLMWHKGRRKGEQSSLISWDLLMFRRRCGFFSSIFLSYFYSYCSQPLHTKHHYPTLHRQIPRTTFFPYPLHLIHPSRCWHHPRHQPWETQQNYSQQTYRHLSLTFASHLSCHA